MKAITQALGLWLCLAGVAVGQTATGKPAAKSTPAATTRPATAVTPARRSAIEKKLTDEKARLVQLQKAVVGRKLLHKEVARNRFSLPSGATLYTDGTYSFDTPINKNRAMADCRKIIAALQVATTQPTSDTDALVEALDIRDVEKGTVVAGMTLRQAQAAMVGVDNQPDVSKPQADGTVTYEWCVNGGWGAGVGQPGTGVYRTRWSPMTVLRADVKDGKVTTIGKHVYRLPSDRPRNEE